MNKEEFLAKVQQWKSQIDSMTEEEIMRNTLLERKITRLIFTEMLREMKVNKA